MQPVTLSIAVGSLDGEAPRIVSAIASRLAVTNAPVWPNIVQTADPLESANAFASGKTDLALSAEMSAICHRRRQSSPCWLR
jgi:hypothetical protein